VLAVVAVGFVAYQTFHPHWPQAAAGGGPPPAPPAAPAAVKDGTNRDGGRSSALPAPVPGLVMDTNFAASRMSGWINAPPRDPFFLADKTAEASSTPMPQWRLKAIWRQGGDTVAAINDGVYRIGDVLDGCIILNINDNEVWFERNGRKMFLGFGNPEPSSTTEGHR
jgi:hypothetical protein